VFRSTKLLSGLLLVGGLIGGLATLGLAQDAPAASTGQKNWKDQAEYDLYLAIGKDTNPQTKLEKLNQWKEKYPSSEYADARRVLFLQTYSAAGQVMNGLAAAKDILASDPKDFPALYYITSMTPQIPAVTQKVPTGDQLADGQKAANALLGGALEAQFASDKKPANVSDEQWKQTRTGVEAGAHTTLGWVAMQQKQNETAEGEFQKSLTIDPNSGQVPFFLGTVLQAEGKEKYSLALFYFARAAAYDGANSLNPQGRQQVNEFLKKAYTKYHGSADDFDKLLQTAKASATPPADFKVVSIVEIKQAQVQKENEEAAKNPSLALWKNMKEQLVGAEGQKYFESGVKDALLPSLSGKVVSMEPALKPKTVVLAIEDGTTPDATLKFETALPGKVDPGTVLTFEGVPEGYAASPFMVTFNVEAKEHLHGWTGTNPKAPVHHAPVRKKPA
jgi:Tfp pilus assembly protein PilF